MKKDIKIEENKENENKSAIKEHLCYNLSELISQWKRFRYFGWYL